MKIFDITRLNQALQMLNEQLEQRNFLAEMLKQNGWNNVCERL